MTRAAHALHVLHPGDVAGGRRGDRFDTLLGSCVALVLTDPRRTFGAMCHIVHATPSPAAGGPDTHHADDALEAMRSLVLAHQMQLAQCEAYVLGGGHLFPDRTGARPVGERNVERVLDFLEAEAVRVLDIDVGGTSWRRLRWTVGPDAPAVTTTSFLAERPRGTR